MTYSDSYDPNLIQRIAAGDESALAALYDQLSGILYSVAVRILQNSAMAEEVTQQAFLEIWQKAALYDPKLGSLITWSVTLTRNRAIDRLRSERRNHRKLVSLAEYQWETKVSDSTADFMEQRRMSERVQRALTDLPAEQRTTIEQAFFQGLSHREISERTGEPLGTVKARIRRGMLRMKDSLQSFSEEENIEVYHPLAERRGNGSEI